MLTGAKAQATTSLRKPKNKRHRISAIQKLQGVIVDRIIPDFEELPPLWPRPRQGLYSLLRPEKEDALMYDDEDEHAFSHFKGHLDIGPAIRPTFTVSRDVVDRVLMEPSAAEDKSWLVNVPALDALQVARA